MTKFSSGVGISRLCFFLLGSWLATCGVASHPVSNWQEEDAQSAVQETEKAPAETGSEKPKREPIYHDDADAKAEIAEALVRAKRENRRVLIQWGGNWCGWCHLLHDMMNHNPRVKKILNYEYDVVLIDIGQLDRNQDLVAKYEADLKKNGVPYLTILDADGNVLVNQETASLESKEPDVRKHDEVAVLEFLVAHQAPALEADAVLADGIEQAKREGKLVFLHFGAPWCGWCHYLEDWLREDSVRGILSPVFIDVKVDIDRMTGGEAIRERFNDQPGGIPWFVFLDPATGEPIVTSDGPKGNVGFPSTDAEIEHFLKMLQACPDRFSADQLSALQDSLVANRQQREEQRRRPSQSPPQDPQQQGGGD